jgi:hypothetical protein
MRRILGCAVLVFLGFGCAVNSAPDVGDSEIGVDRAELNACANPTTCVQLCACDYQICKSQNPNMPRFCDEEHFQCVLACKP